jgi:hypothetical protein
MDFSSIGDVPEPYQAVLTKIARGLSDIPIWNEYKYSCFIVASFVAMVFTSLGFNAKAVSCYAVATKDGFIHGYGAQGLSPSANQVDAHVVCIVDNQLLIDFATAGLTRAFTIDFPSALAFSISPNQNFPCLLKIDHHQSITYHNEWENPRVAALIEEHIPYAKELCRQYQVTSPAIEPLSASRL